MFRLPRAARAGRRRNSRHSEDAVRFGISTHLYHQHPLERAHLLELAEFGFQEVELFATVGHFDYRADRSIEQLAGWLDEAGLHLHSVHAPIVEHLLDGEWGPALSTAASAESARAAAVREAKAALGVARRIPYRFLVTHLGVPDLQAGSSDNSVAAARRSIEEVAAEAAGVNVKLAIEVIPNRLSQAERLVQMLEEDLDLAAPGAGICLDMGHAFLMGDLADAIDTVAGHLLTTHVHDNRGKEDDHLVPFDGVIDWPTTLMSLQKVGYDGVILFELANTSTPREVLKKSVAVRKRFEEIIAE
jgi:sugar phosphate isomerase/epimerase